LKYLQKEREVLLKAESDWLNIVGLNKLLSVINHRILLSEEIAKKAKLQLSKGEIDVIKYHHAQMEFVNLKIECTELEVKRNNLQTDLNLLCGGISILVNDTVFPPMASISLNDITGSYTGTPQVKSLENVVKVRNLDKNIAVSEWLPKFKAGYYSEVVTGLRYQGIQTGISIPLWQNMNSVKTADYQMQVADAELDQLKSQEMAHLVSLFNKRDKLAAQMVEIKLALLPVNDLNLLRKALDSGEINISEFYFEISVFYTSWMGLLKTENELAITDAELKFFLGR
jgi:outer membrane protein TolC